MSMESQLLEMKAAFTTYAGKVKELLDQGGSGLKKVTEINTDTLAVHGMHYVLTGGVTLTLPAEPKEGEWVGFSNRSGTTTAVIVRNSSKIMGLEEDMVLDSENARGTLVYSGQEQGWVLVNE